MLMVGDYQDAAGRNLVLQHETTPFPGFLVFEPDELGLLAKADFNASADHALGVLQHVFADRPDLGPGQAIEAAEVYERTDPAQATLLALEARLETATEPQAFQAAKEIEHWLVDHGADCVQAAPLAWLLLGQARYLTADFVGADNAWRELTTRFPSHPLRHRARYHMLDHSVWPEPAHPSIARARLPNVGDYGVQVPYPAVRTRNLASARTDPRYRFSPSGVPFIEIPAGTFIMGSDPPGSPREWPLRRVTVSRPFLLAAWPVTRALWRGVFPDAWPGVESKGIAGELPATWASWNDYARFIDLLRARDGWPYRFPTEAEWEYAARDGLEQAPFPWGHEPLDPTHCNYNLPRPVPVACYPPTRSGLFDVLGNVCEFASDLWLLDGYERTSRDVVDPRGPSAEEQPSGTRVMMPSGCGSPMCEIHARISWRAAAPPNFASPWFGLRLACDLL